MAITLQIDSFSDLNLRERTELGADCLPGVSTLKVRSTEGLAPDQTIYVGQLSREGCEKAVITSVDDETTIRLSQPLKLPHSIYDPVQAVLGDSINIYRAPNVDGRAPAPSEFTVLATRSIDPDQTSTYYRDTTGSSDYWYCHTYFNLTSEDETERSKPFRGADFNHYASIREIRVEAGFEKAFNLKDSTIDLQRHAAETEINAALAGAYTVPFDPVPEIIHTLTIQLAAALLMVHAYGETPGAKQKLKDARAAIETYRSRESVLVDENGIAMSDSNSVTGWPGDPSPEAPRFFRMRDRF